jgi:lipoyl(octanoyl) transferase
VTRHPIPQLRFLGRVDYALTLEAMRHYTEARTFDSPDQIWLCEHPPVYTLGLAAQRSHLFDPADIPIVATNRGGQVTYHGPGQVVAYPLIDLQRLGIYVKEFVHRLEHCALKTLESWDITGHRVPGAPGIYVNPRDPHGHAARTGPYRDPFEGLAKIAALGIKLTRQRSYHGLSLNVDMNLSPYEGINPCGYAGLRTSSMATLGIDCTPDLVAQRLGALLCTHLSAD